MGLHIFKSLYVHYYHLDCGSRALGLIVLDVVPTLSPRADLLWEIFLM